jgi:hypothetical protein
MVIMHIAPHLAKGPRAKRKVMYKGSANGDTIRKMPFLVNALLPCHCARSASDGVHRRREHGRVPVPVSLRHEH